MGPKMLLSLACATSLIAGAAGGILLDREVLGQGTRAFAEGKREGPVERLTERLDLDPGQAEKVRAVFEAFRPRYLEVMKDVRPKLKRLHEEIDAQLRPILRPKQVEMLAELRREWDEQHPSDAGRR